jgi:hypothetical protein
MYVSMARTEGLGSGMYSPTTHAASQWQPHSLLGASVVMAHAYDALVG